MTFKKAYLALLALSLVGSSSFAFNRTEKSNACENPPCTDPLPCDNPPCIKPGNGFICDNPPCAFAASACSKFVPQGEAATRANGFNKLALCAAAVCKPRDERSLPVLKKLPDNSKSSICQEYRFQQDVLTCPGKYGDAPFTRPQNWSGTQCTSEERKAGDPHLRRQLAAKAAFEASQGANAVSPEKDYLKEKIRGNSPGHLEPPQGDVRLGDGNMEQLKSGPKAQEPVRTDEEKLESLNVK